MGSQTFSTSALLETPLIWGSHKLRPLLSPLSIYLVTIFSSGMGISLNVTSVCLLQKFAPTVDIANYKDYGSVEPSLTPPGRSQLVILVVYAGLNSVSLTCIQRRHVAFKHKACPLAPVLSGVNIIQ